MSDTDTTTIGAPGITEAEALILADAVAVLRRVASVNMSATFGGKLTPDETRRAVIVSATCSEGEASLSRTLIKVSVYSVAGWDVNDMIDEAVDRPELTGGGA